MKGKLIAVIVACCLALSATLLGACSPAVDKSAFVGEWQLLEGSTENLDADTVALAGSLGAAVILTLNEDGTGTLDLYGETSDLTWEAASNEEGTIKVADSKKATLQLQDGNLEIVDAKGGTLTFARP